MEENPEIRDILLKMYELQQKQYEEHKANTALYRQLATRQRMVVMGAGCLLLVLLSATGLALLSVMAANLK